MPDIAIKWALLSVSDKSGLQDFARALTANGSKILSTGGSYRFLLNNDIAAREVADYTQFPEIMDGRVKTLHPKIYAGILARRGTDDELLRSRDILPIDLVVVNLYPFARTVAGPRAHYRYDDAIENIDIGGPAMIRAAAKNHRYTTVVVDPGDYAEVIERLHSGQLDFEFRRLLAKKAFAHTAEYDHRIADWLDRESAAAPATEKQFLPQKIQPELQRIETLRYGENPHQRAALYSLSNSDEPGITQARQIHGRQLSYNNLVDADAAMSCVMDLDATGCVIVKHANPCGVAVAADPVTAWRSAWKTDPTSAFGGIIAFNCAVNGEVIKNIIDNQFVELIIAPDIDSDALEMAKSKPNLRLLVCDQWQSSRNTPHFQQISGGFLVQDRDYSTALGDKITIPTQRKPTASELQDLQFAWIIARHVKSNAIVFARDNHTIGIGAGQMSRIYSTRIAALKAADGRLATSAAVMASDAFFPFRDGIDSAAEYGIAAVIQPGGSKRDDEVIAAADEHDMAMVFTATRHFRH